MMDPLGIARDLCADHPGGVIIVGGAADGTDAAPLVEQLDLGAWV
jgi:hypothetical protein